MSHLSYLSIGSNLGDRAKNLGTAIVLLAPKIQPVLQSSIYQTEPWGYSDQPSFLNQVIKVETNLEPLDLLIYLKGIESQMGRQETFRFGPRLIDLDILFYDELVLDTPKLTIPHPRLYERAFILIPLAEIAPDLNHPVLGKTIQQLKTTVESNSVELFQSVRS
ncbi:MAG: 2-amino-4-hydroxy-6-hydroxymethyldihydropteridine diphosphokinase [Anaerolineales bacterium]